jgi:predicted nucleic acid-binding protein
MSLLVDSDILIEVSRGKDADLVSQWREMGRSDAAILYSPVSVAELWTGARPSEHEAIAGLFGALTCVPIDAAIGRRAGDYLRHYRKSHGMGLGDALIAASAVLNGAALWTRNRKHYPMRELAFY